MDIRERLAAFWSGERPDIIPYTIYGNEFRNHKDSPAWGPMFDEGLGITHHMGTVHEEGWSEARCVSEEYQEHGVNMRRELWRTPVGDLTQTWAEGWQRKYLLESAEDYRVMTHIAKHARHSPAYEAYEAQVSRLQPWDIPLVYVGRTPLQVMLVDYAGLTNFAYHLADFEEEVHDLYDALYTNFKRRAELVAAGPGRFVSCLENFTAESLGPHRYARFLLPAYEECFPMLQAAGKVVGTHYDGRTASCKDLIAAAPIDLIESLTEPPEGDLTLEQCREVWPEKLLWVNIRVGDYGLSPADLKTKVLTMIRDASPDGRRLAFEVSEHIPVNWESSMPVVLEALNEASR